MAILSLRDDGIWCLDVFLEPVEFWPYTTYVTGTILSAPRNQLEMIHQKLIAQFQQAGIKAYAENKSAFGLKDEDGSIWYFGFKDFMFNLGTGVRSDSWIKPQMKAG